MANGIADYLNVSQQDLLGSAAPNMPMANTMMPGYDQEMNIDDTGRITLGSYLKDLQDRAGDGITSVADKGMSLFDNSQRSNLTRAGLGALLFGVNPITALLGAFVGSKTPNMVSAFKENRFNPMEYIREKRAERLAQIDREEKARLASRIRGGGGTIDSGNEGGYGGTGGEGPSAVGSSGMLGGGV